MYIRELDITKDLELYQDIWSWEHSRPRWLQDVDAVHGCETWDEWVERATDPAKKDIGVFTNEQELSGVISLTYFGRGCYEAHLYAKRGSDIDDFRQAAINIREQLFRDRDAQLGFIWTAKINRPIVQLCPSIGFYFDGAMKTEGETRGKPITWMRFSCTRALWETEQLAREYEPEMYAEAMGIAA